MCSVICEGASHSDVYPRTLDGGAVGLETLKARARYNHRRFGFSEGTSDYVDFPLLEKWLSTCEINHRQCRRRRMLSSSKEQWPLWLVDTRNLCLALTQYGDKYAALSYVWGDVPCFKTTIEKLSALRQVGAFSENNPDIKLPRTIRDAILAARRLRLRYLWVDALCIAQDDPESKHAEIEKMGHIYSNASVTLIVCFGNNAECGIPRVDKRRGREQLDLQQDTTWERRGWTFQELALSTRVIIFNSTQCIWSCNQNYWDESFGPSCFQEYGNNIPPRAEYYKRWQHERVPDLGQYLSIVSDYNSRSLTFPGDVMYACAGILSMLEPRFGTFIYGLPEMFFDVALLWQPNEHDVPEKRECSHNIPSWSWMCWKGRLDSESWDAGRRYLPDFKMPQMRGGDSGFQPSHQTVIWSVDSNAEKRRLKCDFARYSSFAWGGEDYGRDLPPGWEYCDTSRPPMRVRNTEIWDHTAFSFPVSAPSPPSRGLNLISPYIYAKTYRGYFGLVVCYDFSYRYEAQVCIDLLITDPEDKGCGAVRLHEKVYPQGESPQEKLRGTFELISLSKS